MCGNAGIESYTILRGETSPPAELDIEVEVAEYRELAKQRAADEAQSEKERAEEGTLAEAAYQRVLSGKYTNEDLSIVESAGWGYIDNPECEGAQLIITR